MTIHRKVGLEAICLIQIIRWSILPKPVKSIAQSEKEEKVDEMRKRFEGALLAKKTPVKDFLRKKKAKKKR